MRPLQTPHPHDVALLAYSTGNLGDEVQSLAARRHVPRVDRHIDRDLLPTAELARPTKLLMNGWYTNRPDLWPPRQSNLDPLLVSVHLSDEYGSELHRLLSPASLAFFAAHGPVGARDTATAALLQEHGVPAYFSGCLTLTLARRHRPQATRTDVGVLTDVSPLVASRFRSVWPGRVRTVTHATRLDRLAGPPAPPLLRAVKFRRAQRFLDHYACAAYVVTSRLHVALPCVALGTPAVLLTPDPDDVRFSGYEDMLTILTVEHFLDRDELPAAATILERYRAARPLRTSLTETCERFFTT